MWHAFRGPELNRRLGSVAVALRWYERPMRISGTTKKEDCSHCDFVLSCSSRFFGLEVPSALGSICFPLPLCLLVGVRYLVASIAYDSRICSFRKFRQIQGFSVPVSGRAPPLAAQGLH